jgi:hypothetical protein
VDGTSPRSTSSSNGFTERQELIEVIARLRGRGAVRNIRVLDKLAR